MTLPAFVAFVALMAVLLTAQVWWAKGHPPEPGQSRFKQTIRQSHRVQLWIGVPALTFLLLFILVSAVVNAIRS